MDKFKSIFGYKTKDYTLTRIFLHGTGQKIKFKTANSGDKLRILLSNKHSPKNLSVRSMFLIVKDIKYRVTLNNKKRFKIRKNTEIYSDEINLFDSDYEEITIHSKFGFLSQAYSAGDFNATSQACSRHYGIFDRDVNLGLRTKAINKPHLQIVILIKQVEVMSAEAKNVIWLGDSLTNHGYYTQALENRFIENDYPVSIINAGHSGNRLLKDGRLLLENIFGIATLKRIEEDVFKYNNPNAVVVAVGVNDLIHPANNVSAEELPQPYEMIDGYLKLLETIRKHKTKAIITTITPFNGYKQNTLPDAEIIRQEVNSWIRKQNDYDLVFDLDKIVRDKEDNTWLAPVFRGDDNLHFLDEGGQVIAKEFDLKSFMKLMNK